MGRVDVKIRIAADGSMSAAMSFDTAHAAASLKARSAELRAALEQAGFNVTDSGLSFTAGGSGRQAGGGETQNPASQRAAPVRLDETTEVQAPPPSSRAAAPGGLDIRI